MSLSNQGKPSRIRSVYGHNTGTSTENVYTCPANCIAEVTFIHIVNGAASGNNTVDVNWYVAADTYTSKFLNNKSIAHDTAVTHSNIDLVLQSGDRIQVTPANSGHIDTIITVTETFIPVG
tara:strand:+ start:597 stop:959 length:363 start_codon:yes stop_codon:yes gene_type:complete